ncbi:MAG: HNH endonuclease [Eubacterium sp.]|nr:HNH endonuclease [Eubacterium sp.]
MLVLGIILLGILVIFLLVKYLKTRHSFRTARRREREKEQEKRATAKRRYITPKLKDYVLERDDYTCQICGISKGLLDSFIPHLGDYLLLEVDHIIPVAKGGMGNDPNNLQTLCWRCNRKKGSTKTNEEVMEIIDYGMNIRH